MYCVCVFGRGSRVGWTRTVPKQAIHAQLEAADRDLLDTVFALAKLGTIEGVAMTKGKLLAALPINMGGLGFTGHLPVADAAYVASRAATLKEVGANIQNDNSLLYGIAGDAIIAMIWSLSTMH